MSTRHPNRISASLSGLAALVSVILASAAIAQVSTIQAPKGLGLAIDSVVVVGHDLALGQTIGSDLTNDGSLLTIDLSTSTVYKIGAAGNVIWRFGRQGGGPGEFRLPYRVCAMADGSALVWDEDAQRVTKIARSGTLAWQRQFGIKFSTIDNLLSLPDGKIVVSGVARSPEAYGFAIHVFSDSLTHVKSFGPLPEAKARSALDSWGAGSITRTQSGTILYVRRLPYDVMEFRADGTVLRKFSSAMGAGQTADDGVVVTRTNSREVRRTLAAFSPGRAFELSNGRYWGGHSVGRAVSWDAFDSRGILLSTMDVPNGISSIVGFDLERQVVWFRGTVEDEPVFFRAHLRSTESQR